MNGTSPSGVAETVQAGRAEDKRQPSPASIPQASLSRAALLHCRGLGVVTCPSGAALLQRAYRLQPDGRSVLQSVTLNQQVAMWPTFTAEEAAHPGQTTLGGDHQKKLAVMVLEHQNWPTPRVTTSAMTVSEAQVRRVQSGEQSERGAGACKLELTVALQEPSGQVAQGSLNTNGKSRARLNYKWVSQLQGFPSDWLDDIE